MDRRADILKILIFIFLFISFSAFAKDTFQYEFKFKKEITFDLSKEYTTYIGTVDIINADDRVKKFRDYDHTPSGYIFNRKTKEIIHLPIILDKINKDTHVYSFFSVLIGSPTYYYRISPKTTTSVKTYLNLNFYPNPKALIRKLLKDQKSLEYHVFNPTASLPESKKTPQFIIKNIRLLPCKHNSFCK